MELYQLGAETGANTQVSGATETVSRRRRIAPLLAWSMWAVSTALGGLNLLIPYLTNPASFANNLLVNLLGTPVLFLYATVGALVASRRPENRVGWLFCIAALLVAIGTGAEEYARYALETVPGSLPFGLGAAWLRAWTLDAGLFLMFTFLLLLFPNGRIPSARWRVTAQLVGVAVILVALIDAFKLDWVADSLHVTNPLAIEGISDAGELFQTIIIPVAIMVCLASVIVRFRQSKGDERLQLKWFAYAAALSIGQWVLTYALAVFMPGDALEPVHDILLTCSLATFPIAAGIAILKYRLYNIDLIVNRTLVYVPLTAILAGVFSVSIDLSQKFFVAATGAQSDAAVVLTTLIVVSSFEPIKSGVQTVVDKRFKEAPDPTRHLRAFGWEVQTFVELNSAERLVQRMLDEVVSAFGAVGGAVHLGEHGHYHIVYASDQWDGEAQITVSLKGQAGTLGLVSLGARRNGLDYTPKDRQTLQGIVDVVAEAIELAGHRK
jgi:hypothetical protein